MLPRAWGRWGATGNQGQRVILEQWSRCKPLLEGSAPLPAGTSPFFHRALQQVAVVGVPSSCLQGWTLCNGLDQGSRFRAWGNARAVHANIEIDPNRGV